MTSAECRTQNSELVCTCGDDMQPLADDMHGLCP